MIKANANANDMCALDGTAFVCGYHIRYRMDDNVCIKTLYLKPIIYHYCAICNGWRYSCPLNFSANYAQRKFIEIFAQRMETIVQNTTQYNQTKQKPKQKKAVPTITNDPQCGINKKKYFRTIQNFSVKLKCCFFCK